MALNLAFQIYKNNKFSQKIIPLNNQEIMDFINKNIILIILVNKLKFSKKH
jgi:hypothetical protein